jgi:hypothetical protein
MFFAGCKDDDVSVERIALDQTDVSMVLGQTIQLKASVTPDNATDKTLAWRSDNDAIASVNGGTVTANSEGTAKITVSSVANPTVKAEATVTVSKVAVPLQSITLNSENVTLASSMTFDLVITLNPSSSTQTLFNYNSSAPGVAQVGNNGTITAVNDGTATITVTSAVNSAISATVAVTVISEGEVPLAPSADRLPVLAYLINDPYQAYGDIGYSFRKRTDGEVKTWPDGGEPGKDMIDAGVTHVIFQTFNHTEVRDNTTADISVRTPKLQAVLNICSEYGLKAFVPFADCWNRDWDDFISGSLDLSSLFGTISSHSAVAGWHGIDEPGHNTEEFNRLKSVSQKVGTYDTRPVHHNLLPNYASGLTEEAAYRAYVRDYLNIVEPPYLSFDNYPLTGSGASVEQGFYENLKIISEEARDAGIPFWAFANTAAFGNQSAPTRQNIRFQVFTNLAYGAQCIQYYPWWAGDATYHTALFGETTTGNRTEYYDEVKVVGLEIKNLSRVFKDAVMREIWFAKGGGIQPKGTVAFDAANLPAVFKTFTINDGGRALISLMEKGDSNYLVIVNGSPINDLSMSIEVELEVREITKSNTAVYASGVQQKTLTGGDILIYEWPK